jgi:FkbM family methyltransferase
VVAFEPVPAVRDRLEANVRLNRLTNVSVRSEAVSDAPGEAAIFVGPASHRGISSFRPVSGSPATVHVTTARLDDLPVARGPVRLVKLDVEGAEYLALCGMRGLLEAVGPDLIVEVSDGFLRELGRSARELCDLLAGLGYRMYVIEWDHLVPVDGWNDRLPDQFNALFTRRPELPATVAVTSAGE